MTSDNAHRKRSFFPSGIIETPRTSNSALTVEPANRPSCRRKEAIGNPPPEQLLSIIVLRWMVVQHVG